MKEERKVKCHCYYLFGIRIESESLRIIFLFFGTNIKMFHLIYFGKINFASWKTKESENWVFLRRNFGNLEHLKTNEIRPKQWGMISNFSQYQTFDLRLSPTK